MNSYIKYNIRVISSIALVLCGCALPPMEKNTGFISSKDLEINRLVNKGIVDFSRSRFIDAEASFLKATQLDPTNTVVLHNLALTQFRNGEFSLAQKNFLKLLEKEVDSVNFHFEFANLLSTIGESERALSFFEVALNLRQEELRKEKELAKQNNLLSNSNNSIAEEENQSSVTSSELTDASLYAPLNNEIIAKLPDIPIQIIYSSLAEVSWRFGDYFNAFCYAQRTYAEDRRIETMLLMLKIVIATDNLDFAKNWLLEEVPTVVRERNSEVLFFLAKIALADGDYKTFIKTAAQSALAFDANPLVDEERDFLLDVLENLGGQESVVPSSISEQILFWPSSLKQLLLSDISPNKIYYQLKLLPIEFKEQIEQLRLQENRINEN
jgi:tetratricopeptide (TPR) repeat protein